MYKIAHIYQLLFVSASLLFVLFFIPLFLSFAYIFLKFHGMLSNVIHRFNLKIAFFPYLLILFFETNQKKKLADKNKNPL